MPPLILLMMEILHDFTYEKCRDSGSIVYIAVSRSWGVLFMVALFMLALFMVALVLRALIFWRP